MELSIWFYRTFIRSLWTTLVACGVIAVLDAAIVAKNELILHPRVKVGYVYKMA